MRIPSPPSLHMLMVYHSYDIGPAPMSSAVEDCSGAGAKAYLLDVLRMLRRRFVKPRLILELY